MQDILGKLVPLLCRLRARTPGRAPLVPSSCLEPLSCAHIQVTIKLGARLLAMYEVAEAAAYAAFAAVEAAAGFAEIGDWRQLAVNRATGVPARVERVASFLSVVFVLESRIDVADEILPC